jgi:hypothetical protein
MSKASPVAIVGAIAYGVGTLADKFLNLSGIISRTLQPAITSMKEGWDRAFTSADKLANLKLGGVRKEIQDVVAALDQATKETNLEKRLADRERAAAAQADVAQIEASTPAGPDRDRAVLARRRQAEEEQRTADEAALATLDSAQKKAAARLAELQANSQRDIAAEEAKTQTLIDRARTTDNEAAWKALGNQRRRLARLQQEYAAEEKRITDELARIQEQQAETRSDMTVRTYETKSESARGTSTETAISERERAEQANRRREALQAEIEASKTELAAARQAAAAAGIELPAAPIAPPPPQAQPAQRREAQPTPAERLDATEPPAALLARRVAAGNTRVDQRLGRAPQQEPAEAAPQAQSTSARSALESFQSSREVDGRRMSERSRSYRDELASLQKAAEKEAEANAEYVAAVTGRINQITAQLTAAVAQLKTQDAQLKTQEDFQ